MAIFVYENVEEVGGEFGGIEPDIEIEAETQDEADDILDGCCGSRSFNAIRDYHLGR